MLMGEYLDFFPTCEACLAHPTANRCDVNASIPHQGTIVEHVAGRTSPVTKVEREQFASRRVIEFRLPNGRPTTHDKHQPQFQRMDDQFSRKSA